jgi:NADPH-dependent ferric siderophore reductase
MARITLSAPAFADFGVAEPGEIITLGWAPPGEELVLPQLGWRFPRGTREQHWRNYTVRRHDPTRAEVDVDFALHDDPGQATRWAADAAPGDKAGFAGPRTHWERDPDADWSLLAADDTGVPAALAILESLPSGHRAIALLESPTTASASPSTPRPTSTFAGSRATAAHRAPRACSPTPSASSSCRPAAARSGARASRARCAASATTCAAAAASRRRR